MQTLTRTDLVAIEDYDHMTIMDENMKWMKLTHLLSVFPLNLRGPSCTCTFHFKTLIALLGVHMREKLYLFLMYTMYENASNKSSFYNHVSTCVV